MTIGTFVRRIALELSDPDFIECKFVLICSIFFCRSIWIAPILVLAAITVPLIVSTVGYIYAANALKEGIRSICGKNARYRQVEVISEEKLLNQYNFLHRGRSFRIADKTAGSLSVLYDKTGLSFDVQCFFAIWDRSYIILPDDSPIEDLPIGQRMLVYHELAHGSFPGGKIGLWPLVSVASCCFSSTFSAALVGINWNGAASVAGLIVTSACFSLNNTRRDMEAEAYADSYAIWLLAGESRDDAIEFVSLIAERKDSLPSAAKGQSSKVEEHRRANQLAELAALRDGQTWNQRFSFWLRRSYMHRWYSFLNCSLLAMWLLPALLCGQFNLARTSLILILTLALVCALWFITSRDAQRKDYWLRHFFKVAGMIDDGQILKIVRDLAPAATKLVPPKQTEAIIAGVHNGDEQLAQLIQTPIAGSAPRFPLFQYAQEIWTICAAIYAVYDVAGKLDDAADIILNNNRKLAVVERTIDKMRYLGLNDTADRADRMVDKVLDYLTRPTSQPTSQV